MKSVLRLFLAGSVLVGANAVLANGNSRSAAGSVQIHRDVRTWDETIVITPPFTEFVVPFVPDSEAFQTTLLVTSHATSAESPNEEKKTIPVRTRQVECAIPVLPVKDLARSIAFYTETLGFKLDWGGAKGETICSVSRDKCSIMLSQNEAIASPGWVWLGSDVSLFAVFREKGVKVVQEPRNNSWAYEMKFADPDGNILWLGSDPRKDLPFEDKK